MMKIAALTTLTSLFLALFVGVPCTVITHGSIAGLIPLMIFGTITTLGIFAEMLILILDA